MMREARFHLDLPGGKAVSAYVLGLAFAFGWTPCIGPILGAGIIKYSENIFSAFNEQNLHQAFSFLPDPVQDAAVSIASMFVGEGWHLTLGIIFMLIVIFLPGGIVDGGIWTRWAPDAGCSAPAAT